MNQDDSLETSHSINTPPPVGDPQKAERYLSTIVGLINLDKIQVSPTDLSAFPQSTLKDHFRIKLQDYEIEISHNRAPETNNPSFIMLFSNSSLLKLGKADKVILAYLHLKEDQFNLFREAAFDQIERGQKQKDEEKFKEVMAPIDQIFEKLLSQSFEEQSPEDKLPS